MIRNIFTSDNKSNALDELLEVINKGIDLLGKENIDKELFNAWSRYAKSTIELIDTAYNTNFSIGLLYDEENLYNPFYINSLGQSLNNSLKIDRITGIGSKYFPTTSNSAMSGFDVFNNNVNNKMKNNLITILKNLVLIVKKLPKE